MIRTKPEATYRDAAVLYYWKQCGHCKTFAPVFKEATSQASLGMPHLTVYAIEVMEQRDKLIKLGVDLGDGVPRLVLYNHAGADHVYDGPRTVEGVQAAIREHIPPPATPALRGGGVAIDALSVNPATMSYPSVVLYYSHTCGFCRAFFPTYLEFARAHKPAGVEVVAVDVKQYPTAMPALPRAAGSTTVPHIVFHHSPERQSAFRERRTLQNLVDFATAQARKRGGGGSHSRHTPAAAAGIANALHRAVDELNAISDLSPSTAHVAFVGWSRQLSSPQDKLYVILVNSETGTVGIIQGKRKGPLVAGTHSSMDVDSQIRRKLQANFEPARFTDAAFSALQSMGYSLDL
jgi:thiol-disulfide isomerase/thioredoxin